MTPAPQPSEYERVKIFSLVKDEDGTISRVPMCLCELCRVNHFLCPRYASRSSAAGEAEKVLVQCETCFLKGTRACMYHGYPDDTIPKSCRYKVGVNAQFALDNLAGTFVIKNLRQQGEREQ